MGTVFNYRSMITEVIDNHPEMVEVRSELEKDAGRIKEIKFEIFNIERDLTTIDDPEKRAERIMDLDKQETLLEEYLAHSLAMSRKEKGLRDELATGDALEPVLTALQEAKGRIRSGVSQMEKDFEIIKGARNALRAYRVDGGVNSSEKMAVEKAFQILKGV